MSFLTIILTFMLHYYLPNREADPFYTRVLTYAHKIIFNLSIKNYAPLWQWILLALLPALLIATAFHALTSISMILGLMFNVFILYLTLNIYRLNDGAKQILSSLEHQQLEDARIALSHWLTLNASEYSEQQIIKKAIEESLVQAHYQWYAPLFWFIVSAFLGLGAAGVVLYRFTEFLTSKANSGIAAKIAYYLNTPSIKLSAWGYAIVGDFEDALYCWREQASSWHNHHHGILLSAGAGALEVKLGGNLRTSSEEQLRPELGLGDEADIDYLKSAIGLIWRVLILMTSILLLLTFAYWLGAR